MRRVYKIENLQSKIDGILVRPVRQDDAADLYAIISQPAVSRTLVQSPSIEFMDTLDWIKKQDQHYHRLVAEVDGRVVGSGTMTAVTRARRNHTGELGLMVHPDYWNQRVGTSLMAGLLNIADNWLNLRRIELKVFEENTAAIKLYENFGFEKECHIRRGTFGDGGYLNEFFMARLRGFEGIETAGQPTPANQKNGDKNRKNIDNLKIRSIQPDYVEDIYHLWGHPKVGRTKMQLPSQ
jgi:putative acetyltransferase